MYYAGKVNSDPKPEKQENPKKKGLKRVPLKKKFKATGEKEVFAEIWSERPHVCVNCKEHLGNEAKAWFFAHIKSKKKFPELRLDKNNIQLLCLKCHHEFDNGTKESFTKRTKP